ncbi:entericidin A/B family lipoprotein [Paraurantiacibacter namhicola]|uniref:Entericidin EcnA/B family protein n=1 Tax=Paraurantiacibacter namhicola TaxID=645517 RepID=A0A1C7D834_9SPHN|nr:entericidin A/B family lipoprotein [Paraurantiacibacter namhicola]ANU07522.1 Entericidin EcnA/B family protein [Paraurantiacibacter namhicola]
MVRKILKSSALAALALAAAACNTVQGVGEDIESVGEAGERAID